MTSIRRTNSSSSHRTYHPHTSYARRRDASVPGWPTNNGPSSSSSAYYIRGRPRASTATASATDTNPTLAPGGGRRSATHQRPSTPESGNSSNGMAEDYFTYISSNQPSQHQQIHTPQAPPQQQPQIAHMRTPGDREPSIPEIRLGQQDDPDDKKSITIAVPPHPELTSKAKSQDWSSPTQLYLVMEDVWQTLFPTLQDWQEKTAFAKLSSVVAVPVVLLFTLTLPVAEDVKIDDVEVTVPGPAPPPPEEDEDEDEAIAINTQLNTNMNNTNKSYLTVPSVHHHASDEDGLSDMDDEGMIDDEMNEESLGQDWHRWLLATQAVLATTFVFGVMARKYTLTRMQTKELKPNISLSVNAFISARYVVVGFLIGCGLATAVFMGTKKDTPPQWFWMMSFVGFVIALNWIFLLANSMVGLLQALGTILSISDAIMGLTIFALGNSVGDFVANTAIAKVR